MIELIRPRANGIDVEFCIRHLFCGDEFEQMLWQHAERQIIHEWDKRLRQSKLEDFITQFFDLDFAP